MQRGEDQQRADKIGDHRIDNANYLNKIDIFTPIKFFVTNIGESRTLLTKHQSTRIRTVKELLNKSQTSLLR